MKSHRNICTFKRLFICFSLLGSISVIPSLQANNLEKLQKWQLKLLFEPPAHQLQRERKGFITIFEGITDKTIDRAMDTQFDRLSSMMFIRTLITDKDENIIKDPDTREAKTIDDDC